jgi:CBS domain-containing protein
VLKAKDIMNTNVVSVKKDTPIFEAVELLVEYDISGLPVVEDDMTLAGILSEKDVVDLFYEESDGAENKTVSDYMTDPAVQFEENSALVNICDFLLKNIFRRVPVTSGGKLIGIISVKDVLNSVLQLRQEKGIMK